MLNKIDVKALGIGTVADISATVVISWTLVVLQDEPKESAIIELLFGLLCVTFGGFVAAKIASTHKLYNATFVGVIGILISLPFISNIPLWYLMISMILMPFFAYAGGAIEKKYNKAH